MTISAFDAMDPSLLTRDKSRYLTASPDRMSGSRRRGTLGTMIFESNVLYDHHKYANVENSISLILHSSTQAQVHYP